MRSFLRFISLLLHPLYIPFAGTMAYFLIEPHRSTFKVQSNNILPIFILTIIIPIIGYLILKNLGVVQSIHLNRAQERKYPLYLGLALLLLVLFKVIPNHFTPALHFYFAGLIVATFCALVLLFLRFKCSIHMMAMGSFLVFLINLSLHFQINITVPIAIATLFCGLTASSRLYLKAHTGPEVLIGFALGICTQFMTVKYWL